MIGSALWLMLLAADCSTTAQACPPGRVCTASGTVDDCPGRGRCEPLPTAAEIELSLPVAKGERVFCASANLYRPKSACAPRERFGLALASTAFEAPHVVVASADGVAYFWGGCFTDNLTPVGPETPICNGGYGNYVRIQHTADLFTEYQHLSAVLVQSGETVKRGQPIWVSKGTRVSPDRSTFTGALTEARPSMAAHRSR